MHEIQNSLVKKWMWIGHLPDMVPLKKANLNIWIKRGVGCCFNVFYLKAMIGITLSYFKMCTMYDTEA